MLSMMIQRNINLRWLKLTKHNRCGRCGGFVVGRICGKSLCLKCVEREAGDNVSLFAE